MSATVAANDIWNEIESSASGVKIRMAKPASATLRSVSARRSSRIAVSMIASISQERTVATSAPEMPR